MLAAIKGRQSCLSGRGSVDLTWLDKPGRIALQVLFCIESRHLEKADCFMAGISKKPDLNDPKLRAKLM